MRSTVIRPVKMFQVTLEQGPTSVLLLSNDAGLNEKTLDPSYTQFRRVCLVHISDVPIESGPKMCAQI
jgi:hypothetical protein